MADSLPPGLTVSYGLLSVVISLVNLSVLMVILVEKSLRTYTNGFIASLCVTDLLFGAVFLPVYIAYPHHGMNGYVTGIVLFTNVSNLSALTAERFIAVTKPIQYRYLISKYFIPLIFSAWFFPITAALLPLSWNGKETKEVHNIYLITVMIIFFLLPYIFVLATYGHLFLSVRRRRKGLHTLSSKKASWLRTSQAEIKVARIFFIIAAVFAISWLPSIYMTTCLMFGRIDLVPVELRVFSIFALAGNSLTDGIIYVALKPDLRRVLKRMSFYKPFRPRSMSRDATSAITNMHRISSTPSPLPSRLEGISDETIL